MKAFIFLGLLSLPICGFAAEIQPAGDSAGSDSAAPNVRSRRRLSSAIPQPRPIHPLPALPPRPPVPEGVTDIDFDDIFQTPVGPLGLELSDKIKTLNGKRVRIAGYQVAEMVGVCNAEPNGLTPARKARAMMEASVPGRLLLCATPEAVNFSHYGLCEDLPPQVVFVTVPELFGEIVPHHPQPLLLVGTLDVGNRQEPDGRVSVIRLKLDPQSSLDSPKATPESAAPKTAATTKTNP